MEIYYSPFSRDYLSAAYGELLRCAQARGKRIFVLVPELRKLRFEEELFAAGTLRSFLNLEVLSPQRFFFRLKNELGLPAKGRDRIELSSFQSFVLLYRELKTVLQDKTLSTGTRQASREMAKLSLLQSELETLRRAEIAPAELLRLAAEYRRDLTILPELAEKVDILARTETAYQSVLEAHSATDPSGRFRALLSCLDRLAELRETLLRSAAETDELPLSYQRMSAFLDADYFILGQGENRYASREEIGLFTRLEKLGQRVCLTLQMGDATVRRVSEKRDGGEELFAPAAALYEELLARGISPKLHSCACGEAERSCFAALARAELQLSGEGGELSPTSLPLLSPEDREVLRERVSFIYENNCAGAAERCVRTILALHRDKNVPYREIAVATAGGATAETDFFLAALEEYGVPYFYDAKVKLEKSPLFQHLRALFSLAESSPSALTLKELFFVLRSFPGFRIQQKFDRLENFLRARTEQADQGRWLQLESELEEEATLLRRNTEELGTVSPEETERDLASVRTLLECGDEAAEVRLREMEWRFGERNLSFLFERTLFLWAKTRFVDPLFRLLRALRREKTARARAEAVFTYLEQVGAEQAVDREYKDLKERAGQRAHALCLLQSWKFLLTELCELVELFGEEELSLYEFRESLLLSFEKEEAAILPLRMDQIYVGSPEHLSQRSQNYLFLLQAEEGKFPHNAQPCERYFDRAERACLISFPLADPELAEYEAERLILWNLLSSVKKKLFLVFGGEAETRSGLYTRLETLLCEGEEERSSFVQKQDTERSFDQEARFRFSELAAWNRLLSSEEAGRADGEREGTERAGVRETRRFFDFFGGSGVARQDDLRVRAQALLEKTERQAEFGLRSGDERVGASLRELFRTPRTFSVSRLECFAACPYRYFLQYVLSLKERKTYRADAAHLGTLIHLFYEKLFAEFAERLQRELTGEEREEAHGQDLRREGLAARIECWNRCLNGTPYMKEDSDKEGKPLRRRWRRRFSDYLEKILEDGAVERLLRTLASEADEELRRYFFSGQFHYAAFVAQESLKRSLEAMAARLRLEEKKEQETEAGDGVYEAESFCIPLAFECAFCVEEKAGDSEREEASFGARNNDRREVRVESVETSSEEETALSADFTLRGIIDRVDASLGGRSCLRELRIVDYKTGKIKIDFEKLANGRSLQLPIYMSALDRMLKTAPEEKEACLVRDAVYLQLHPGSAVLDAERRERWRVLRAEERRTNGAEHSRLRKQQFLEEEKAAGLELLSLRDSLKKTRKLTDERSVQNELETLREQALRHARAFVSRIIQGDFPAEAYFGSQGMSCSFCPYYAACALVGDGRFALRGGGSDEE